MAPGSHLFPEVTCPAQLLSGGLIFSLNMLTSSLQPRLNIAGYLGHSRRPRSSPAALESPGPIQGFPSRHLLRTLLISFFALLSAPSAWGAQVLPAELEQSTRWADALFRSAGASRPRPAGLMVLANHRQIQRNERDGKPLMIGTNTYARGLYCHARSRILVRLPGPGARFAATIGIETGSGDVGGSVQFEVSAGHRNLYCSQQILRGQEGIPIDVDLAGASEFTLTVTNGGDDASGDQAAWAEAKVTLVDDQEIWIADLPQLEATEPLAFDTQPPFTFQYDGKPSSEFLSSWEERRTSHPLDDSRIQHTRTYTDPQTGLEVRWEAIEYTRFPTVEWILYFKNRGEAPTAILSEIKALDTRVEQSARGQCLLHHHRGTIVAPEDYEPWTTILSPGQSAEFAPPGGRPVSQVFPYFNLEWAGEGLIVVVGWPGQWSAAFARDYGVGLRVTAGQELTHFRLEPGEEIRTPLMVLQFWKQDRIRSQNIWRRWMLAHNLPRIEGRLIEPVMPAVSGNQFPGLLCNEADEIRYIDRYAEEKIPITHWWMDAGWYINKGTWWSVGTWEIDRNRFPRGIRPISDHAHAQGLQLILWFEPERVTSGSWLATERPQWVLGGERGGLLNLGDPPVWDWLVNFLDKFITEEGVDVYRQDFGLEPIQYWRPNDTPERQGISEIRHVQGYLDLWDELRRRHPKLWIDSCSGGGNRNDLETMRRSVPLLRSDYILDPVANQGHTYGLASWIPYFGTGFIDFNPYLLHSMMGPGFTLSCDARRRDLDWDGLRKLVAQWRRVVPNFFGDFYPLLPYSLSNSVWMAWQFDRPEVGEGILQVFRRSHSAFRSAELPLRGLDPQADYIVTDLGAETSSRMTGKQLMEAGLPIEIAEKPGSILVLYKKAE